MMDRAIIKMRRWANESKGYLDFKGATKGGSVRVLTSQGSLFPVQPNTHLNIRTNIWFKNGL